MKFSWGLDGCARRRKVTVAVAIKSNLGSIFNEFMKLGSKLGLGLGRRRAVAQVYNYSYNTIKLVSNFKKNVRS